MNFYTKFLQLEFLQLDKFLTLLHANIYNISG